jgi:hypothetical protein
MCSATDSTVCSRNSRFDNSRLCLRKREAHWREYKIVNRDAADRTQMQMLVSLHTVSLKVHSRDVSDFRFFPLLELPIFKINKNKFLCSSDVPIFGLQSTQICNKNFFLTILLPTSDFRFFLGSTGHIPDADAII